MQSTCCVDWAKFDETPMDVAPIAAEPIPWQREAVPVTSTDMIASSAVSATAADDSWADFSGGITAVTPTQHDTGWTDFSGSMTAVTTTLQDPGWADFASFESSTNRYHNGRQ